MKAVKTVIMYISVFTFLHSTQEDRSFWTAGRQAGWQAASHFLH
jgi:hypothetical protein